MLLVNLQWAAAKGPESAIRMLLDAGIDPIKNGVPLSLEQLKADDLTWSTCSYSTAWTPMKQMVSV